MKPRQYARRARTIQRAVILTRVSTDSQADNTSHETQLKACQDFCEKRGWQVVANFEEVESGALYLSRVETQAALELIEAHKADALVLYDMTRYGRDVEYQHKILKRIVAAGAQLQFSTFPLEYDSTGELTPESEQMFNLLGGTSSAERKYIRRRMANGKARKVAEGIQLARTMSPWGWKIVDKKAVIRGEYGEELEGFYMPIPATLEIVRDQIFTPYAAGSSLGQVAKQLAQNGVPTPRGGRNWQPCGVRYILQNPVYMGRPAYGRNQNLVDDERRSLGMDKIFVRPREMADWKFLDTPAVREHFARPDIAPLLVEESIWWECQKRLSENRAERSGRKDRKYPLSGLLLCHLCGRKLVGRISKSGRYRTMADGSKVLRPEIESRSTRQYVCVDKVRFNAQVADRCNSPLWNAALVESFVYDAVAQVLSNPSLLRKAESEYNASQAATAPPVETPEVLQAQLQSIERKELLAAESKVEARFNGTSTAPYDVMLTRLAQEKREVQKRLESSQVNEIASEPVDVPLLQAGDRLINDFLNSGEASDAEKNELLLQMIESVIIVPSSPEERFAGRAAGVELKLKTGTPSRFLVQINQLKTKRSLKIQFLDSSRERHK